jgi:hypothetical protein
MMPAPSEQTRRRKLLFALAGFVVVVGGASLVVTGGVGKRLSPTSTQVGGIAITPGPAPPVCGSAQLQLFGAFDECASIDRSNPASCTVSRHVLEVTLNLAGTSGDRYLVDLGIPNFVGTGDYYGDGVYVIVRELASTPYWQSLTDVLNVTADDGSAGRIYANLQPYDATRGGVPESPLPLRIDGPWQC